MHTTLWVSFIYIDLYLQVTFTPSTSLSQTHTRDKVKKIEQEFNAVICLLRTCTTQIHK